MGINWREIDALLEELSLEGCQVQQVHQPSHDSLVMELYCKGGPSSLFVSLDNRNYRLHRLTRRLPNPKSPPRFATFLRAHIRGGRIERVYQLDGQRVVRMDVRRGEERTTLWIRLWGSAANIIATDPSGTIREAFYRRPARGEVAGGHYDPESELAGEAPPGHFEVRDYPGEGDLNSRLERYFRELEREAEIEQLRKAVLKDLDQREKGLLMRLRNIGKKQERQSDPERLRELGDLLKASLHLVTPGQDRVEVSDYYNEGRPVSIELDTRLTPAENAEAYYERYRKSRTALARMRDESESLKSSLAEVGAERERLSQERSLEALRSLRKEVPRVKQTRSEAPGLQFTSGPHRILVGRTARDNDALLRGYVSGNDYWFHARDWPGAYVFVKTLKGKSVPLETMLDAGNLAIFYSKARTSGSGDIYYTQVKFLRRAKNGKTGLVLPTREKNLHVRLEPERIERLRRSQVA